MVPKISKLKVSEKARKLVFPEMLGSLVVGREERNYIMGSDKRDESTGEELRTFEPHGFALKHMIKDQTNDFDEELSVPQKTNRSLGAIVHACINDDDDEKRSDLEYEVRLVIIIFITMH